MIPDLGGWSEIVAILASIAAGTWIVLTRVFLLGGMMKKIDLLEEDMRKVKSQQEALTWHYIDIQRELAEKPTRAEFNEGIESIRRDIRGVSQDHQPQRS